MNRKRITFAGLAAAAAVAVPVLPAPAGAATVHQFEGTVISVNRSAQSFRLRDVERGTVVVAVTRSTRYERVGGFAGLRSGMRSIEATVRRAGGRWVAVDVQRSGGGGAHGGRSGADDNGGGRRGADDNGGGRRGADDGGGRHGAHHGPNHG
jgi:hypothetical protein